MRRRLRNPQARALIHSTFALIESSRPFVALDPGTRGSRGGWAIPAPLRQQLTALDRALPCARRQVGDPLSRTGGDPRRRCREPARTRPTASAEIPTCRAASTGVRRPSRIARLTSPGGSLGPSIVGFDPSTGPPHAASAISRRRSRSLLAPVDEQLYLRSPAVILRVPVGHSVPKVRASRSREVPKKRMPPSTDTNSKSNTSSPLRRRFTRSSRPSGY